MNCRSLIWQRVHCDRHQPSGREGHTLVSFHDNAYMFGGYENGAKGNSVERFHVPTRKWTKEECVGTPPSPRGYHCACQYEEFMIVHGGEGTLDKAEYFNDVCLNDPMGSSRKHSKVIKARQDNGSSIRCLDDMYLYNMLNRRWTEVKSSLSPLPRKGHTLCVG